jgi:S1-C subfamily serine protease
MKAYTPAWALLVFLAFAGQLPAQPAADEKTATPDRAAEEQKQAQADRKTKAEWKRIIKKYAKFSTEQLLVKEATLSQEVAGGYTGQGLHGLVAQLEWERKVKERDEIVLEIFRRREEEEKSRASRSGNGNLRVSGTGFLITADGYLITNHHVVKGAAQIRVLTLAGRIPAKVVKVDAANDLALLKAEGTFSPVPVATSRTVRLGGTVATVGFPDPGLQGFAPKLAKGEIASLSGPQDDPRFFQISLPVQPGNSGGALVDQHGNVVGIVSAKLNARAALVASGALPENVNYAVKSSFLLSFLESLPEVVAKLKEPNTQSKSFEDVIQSAQDAAVMVMVY